MPCWVKKIMGIGLSFGFVCAMTANGQTIEISGSPFDTQGAPLPDYIHPLHEKVIIVDPAQNVWAAYQPNGKMVRWGIATAGATRCQGKNTSCRTTVGAFRIYSLGNQYCVSRTYPSPGGGAAMPYCMYFNEGEALHGATNIQFSNISHGCVRIHIADAKWLRYQFVEKPQASNHFQGTKIIIKKY